MGVYRHRFPYQILARRLVCSAGGTTYNDSGSGTITLSGSRVEAQTHSGTGSGTVTLTGSRSENQTHTATGTGTVTLSGSGAENYQPPSGPSVTGYDQAPEILLQRLPH